VLAAGGRFAFTAWVTEGNVADAIVDEALAAHAAPVALPIAARVVSAAAPVA
jgi:hypothetical protein